MRRLFGPVLAYACYTLSSLIVERIKTVNGDNLKKKVLHGLRLAKYIKCNAHFCGTSNLLK